MTTRNTYRVAGMTCGHCVAAVTEELEQLAGVTQVEVDLTPGAESAVRVTSERGLRDDEVRDAVDEAGYELVGGAR